MRTTRACFGIVTGMLLVMVGSVGCRQPDGAIPLPTGEQVNETADVARDLLNVAAGQPDAVRELNDDLYDWGDPVPPPQLVDSLTERLATALSGKSTSEAAAQELANVLFVIRRARELSPRQIEQMRSELRAALTKAGAAEGPANDVSVAAYDLQTTITQNRRRWYHFF
jgi:septum formation topological specificity factor MinE